MKRSVTRLLALLLCGCLLAASAAGETYLSDNEVTHVAFTAQLRLHADGFPQDTPAHVADWEHFLNKVSLRGDMNVLDLLTPYSRVYLDGAIRLNGKDTLPFVYDGYHSYRYVTSPVLGNENLFFQMHNFLEFMLKPYDYLELPTQYPALAMYPEATVYIIDTYYRPLAELIASAEPSEGDPATRVVSYDTLYQLCEDLDPLPYVDDGYSRVYNYVNAWLTQAGATDTTLDALSALETWLEFLDPEQEGLLIREKGGETTYTIGKNEVFRTSAKDGATTFVLTLPSEEGYLLTLTYAWTPGADGDASLEAHLTIALEESARLDLIVTGDGMPCEGSLKGSGRVNVALGGELFEEALPAQTFAFSWNRTAAEKPFSLHAELDCLHPQTGTPALTLVFDGDFAAATKKVFKERAYSTNDLFSISEAMMEEYIEKFTKPVALYMVPFLLETPSGVIADVMRFLDDTQLLSLTNVN